jgi:hypothetical protein
VDPLTITRVANIRPAPSTDRWLVEGLWGWPAVGFIGGTPKASKTWLALELAVAVASGRPCLGRFPVHKRGPVLLVAAEDSPADIRQRVQAIAKARGVDLDTLPVGLVTETGLMLDQPDWQRRLRITLAKTKPRLLILDPMVRLHRGDENSASEVSELLGFLRGVQRDHQVAICLVHHIRKAGASQPGQALRGSGDLHAWIDSGLYMIKRKDGLQLHVEHRANPSPEPVRLRLEQDPPRLEVIGELEQQQEPTDDALDQRVLLALRDRPRNRTDLREILKIRNETLGLALRRLEGAGAVRLQGNRWAVPVPAP